MAPNLSCPSRSPAHDAQPRRRSEGGRSTSLRRGGAGATASPAHAARATGRGRRTGPPPPRPRGPGAVCGGPTRRARLGLQRGRCRGRIGRPNGRGAGLRPRGRHGAVPPGGGVGFLPALLSPGGQAPRFRPRRQRRAPRWDPGVQRALHLPVLQPRPREVLGHLREAFREPRAALVCQGAQVLGWGILGIGTPSVVAAWRWPLVGLRRARAGSQRTLSRRGGRCGGGRAIGRDRQTGGPPDVAGAAVAEPAGNNRS